MSSPAATQNGVDLAVIGEFAQQLASDPNADKSRWSARTTWTGAFTSSTSAREHEPIVSDEPASASTARRSRGLGGMAVFLARHGADPRR